MKKGVKILLVLMSILTMIYIGAVVYANTNSSSGDRVYAAFEHETEPPFWYTPEELGIIKIIEYGNESYWLHVVVDVEKEPFPLQVERPIFKYKDKFFQISDLWITPGLPESVKQWQVPAGVGIVIGWIVTGIYKKKETKKMISIGSCCLLITGTFGSFLSISAVETAETTNLMFTPALPEDIPLEPLPENSTSEDYLNATNVYVDTVTIQGYFEEVREREGTNPIYVRVFVDEEERQNWRYFPWDEFPIRSWKDWAKFQIERGDEALVANFGIDIRILGFEEWESNNSITTMHGLWYDLEAKTQSYLRQLHNGENWLDYVDAIIGITSQATPGDPYPIAGVAPSPTYINQGKIFILLKWQVYWANDNLVQHEVSHLFHADDHYHYCCVMAYHTHFQTVIYEDAFWAVFNDVHCAYTTYFWHTDCQNTINSHRSDYEYNDYGSIYLFYWYNVFFTKPMVMYYWYNEKDETITIECKSGRSQATIR